MNEIMNSLGKLVFVGSVDIFSKYRPVQCEKIPYVFCIDIL